MPRLLLRFVEQWLPRLNKGQSFNPIVSGCLSDPYKFVNPGQTIRVLGQKLQLHVVKMNQLLLHLFCFKFRPHLSFLPDLQNLFNFLKHWRVSDKWYVIKRSLTFSFVLVEEVLGRGQKGKRLLIHLTLIVNLVQQMVRFKQIRIIKRCVYLFASNFDFNFPGRRTRTIIELILRDFQVLDWPNRWVLICYVNTLLR